MKTKQTIAIIGASGNMGSAVAKNLSKGNNRLLLFANDREKVETVVNQIKSGNPLAEVEALDCPTNAAWEADIIILAVPHEAEKEIAEKIKEVANQKIVISIANALNETHNGLITVPGTIAAAALQQLLPNSKVVKAFNTTFAAGFVTPVFDGQQADAFVEAPGFALGLQQSC